MRSRAASETDRGSPVLELSVVLPVFNEAENLPILWGELMPTLAALGLTAEVLVVDDGSTDSSVDVVRRLSATDPRVRLIRLARNAGLSAAFAAGLLAARGRVVVTLDADLQSDPADIPALLRHLDQWDAACGWRRTRRDPWLKRVSSRIANAVRAAILGDRIRDSACSLRAMHRRCVEALEPFNGFHRFLPALLRQAGYRVIEVPVNHRPRRFGTSHYGVRNRVWRGLVDVLGVRWMQSRRLRYELVDDGPASGRDDDAPREDRPEPPRLP